MPKTKYDPQVALDLAILGEEDKPAFIEKAFGISLWETQRELIESFFSEPETAVRSCHSSGKSLGAAAAAMCAVMTEPECIVLVMSASWEQVQSVLFSEMHKLINQCCIGGYPDMLKTSWQLGPRRFLLGLSPDNATRIHGFHAKKVHIIVDEAAGIEHGEVFQALDSLRASISFDFEGRPNVSILYTMNPTRSSGPEVELFHKYGVKPITIDAFRSPNFHKADGSFISVEEFLALPLDKGGPLDRMVKVPYLITPRYAREVYEENGDGPASPWWARVRGEFPQQDMDSLIFMMWVKKAIENEAQLEQAKRDSQKYALTIGLDVAGPGNDETAWTVRRGPLVVEQGGFREPDPIRAKNILKLHLAPFLKENCVVNIDSAGIGHYLALALNSWGIKVSPINVGHRAFDSERFLNYKAECYWGLRERFAEGRIAGNIDTVCQNQLSNILYDENASNQIMIEPKKKAKARGLKSPDRAESLMLAFATTPDRKETRGVSYTLGYEREEQERKPSKWLASRRRKRYDAIAENIS